MTLNLMIINKGGIWQTADLRITNPLTGKLIDDRSIKQVEIRCNDGIALLTYTGIGSVKGIHISDWIRRILRGKSRTIDETLIFLREQSTNDIGPIAMGRFHHTFTIGIILHGQMWWVQIRNFNYHIPSPGELDKTGIYVYVRNQHNQKVEIRILDPPSDTFVTAGGRVDDNGLFCAIGTAGSVLPEDMQLLDKVKSKKPRDPKEFQNLLYSVNKRASASVFGKGFISPHCTSAYVPNDGKFAVSGSHHGFDERSLVTVPFIFNGIDLTEIMHHLDYTLDAKINGTMLPHNDFDSSARRSVTPDNPLKK